MLLFKTVCVRHASPFFLHVTAVQSVRLKAELSCKCVGFAVLLISDSESRIQYDLRDLDRASPVPGVPSYSRGHGFKSRS